MAPSCSHWIWHAGGDDLIHTRSDRMRECTSGLPASATFPKLLLFVGGQNRPGCSPRPARRPDRLCLDLCTDDHEPVLVGTASLKPRLRGGSNCCTAFDGFEKGDSRKDSHTHLYSTLLYPFVDVFCFYAYGTRDLTKIAEHLVLWMKQSSLNVRQESQPRIVIALEGNYWRKSRNKQVEEFEGLLNRDAHTFVNHFSSLDFVRTYGSFKTLKSYAMMKAKLVEDQRKLSGHLFSVRHANSLFDRFANRQMSPQRYLHFARQDFPVKKDRSRHIETFMSLVRTANGLENMVAEVVASSILLEQYPPGMHLFQPNEVFEYLYKSVCSEASENAISLDRFDGAVTPYAFSNLVLQHFVTLFEKLDETKSASELHKATLTKFRWTDVKSDDTCLVCLARVPQYKAPCGHKYCELCLEIFGDQISGSPWNFRLNSCLLCHEPADINIRVRPPTAGQNILCIDGGGVRGIIPLMMLAGIQEQLDLPIPVQEFFTLSYGTSVGALILLLLYMKGWDLGKCIAEYEALAGKAFQTKSRNLIRKWIHLLILDSLYPSTGIEEALKDICGDRNMSDLSYASEIGAKFGLLAASVAQPSICVFGNYNGVGDPRSGYHVPRSLENVKACQVGQVNSAAPLYFPPKYLAGLDSFQDAAVLQNNPVPIAMSEFVAMYGEDKPDVVANFGCGNAPLPELVDRKVRLFRDSWLCRVPRAFMSLMEGSKPWTDASRAMRKSPVEDGHYRLDITLENPPALDDVSKIPILKSLVCKDLQLQKTIREIAARLFATLFYLELAEPPRRINQEFSVRGRLLCSRTCNDPAMPQILQRLSHSNIRINGKATSSRFESDTRGNIYQEVSCYSGDTIHVEIKENNFERPFPISGSPFRIDTLVSRGGLTTYFGNSVHKRKAVDPSWYEGSGKRQRK